MQQGQGKSRRRSANDARDVPHIWLMTDERVPDTDLFRAIRRLPRGSAIVVRHHTLNEATRHSLFGRIRSAARRRGCLTILASDAALAQSWGADGHHSRTSGQPGQRTATPRRAIGWLHSAPVHNARELVIAVRAGADAILLSPLFATRSHPGASPLGPARFAALARRSSVPVIALGGVWPRHGRLVRQLGASGFAAIDGLIAQSGSAV